MIQENHNSTPSPSDAEPAPNGSIVLPRTFIILAVGAAAMACLLALLPAAGHDQMWLLLAASRLLHGAKPYGAEVFESNPPLILWLSIPPAWLAEHLHFAPTAVGKAFVIALEAATAAISLALFRRLRALERRPIRPADTPALLFVFITLYAVLPARDFGQKDHLLALLCLPYLLSAAIRLAGGRLPTLAAAAIGVTGGVGIALKPHQILLPIAVESAVLVLSRWQWRRLPQSDTVALVLTLASYPLLVQHFAPNYLSQVVPLLRQTYWAFGHLGPVGLLAEAPQLHILILLVAAGFAVTRARRVSALSTILAAAGLASTLAYYAQRTGWYYQQLPALTFFALALVSLALDYLDPNPSPSPAYPVLASPGRVQWLPRAAAALSALAVFLTAHFMGCPFTPARSFPIDSPDPSVFANLPPGTAVATLTTSPEESVPPVFRYNLVLAQRYPHLWLLPAILRNEDPQGRPPAHPIPPAQLAALDALQHRFMVEDLARWRPALILVERCQDPAVRCQVLEDRHDDLLAWFLRDPAFRAEFAHYRPYRTTPRFDAYLRTH